MRVMLTGSTGMVGKGVLLECMDHPEVTSILVINRHPLDIRHPKIKEILHTDFYDWSTIRDQLSGYDACFFCLGVSSAGMKEAVYRRLTYDLTLGFAGELLAIHPGMTFCYVSGAGTDSTEQGRTMWSRVKGKTENDLLALGFKHAYMFRPGYIHPMRGLTSRTPLYNLFYTITKPLYFILRLFPKYVTDTVRLGRAMIRVGLRGYDRQVLENEDINHVALQRED